jgi:hypothetical protein
VAAATGIDLREIKRILPGMNALAGAFLRERLHPESAPDRALTVARLSAFGLARDGCRVLVARGFVSVDGHRGASSRILLTQAGLAFLQAAIPAGAPRPVYNVDARVLSVLGDEIATLAVQARSQSAILAALEHTGWQPRVANPLAARPCRNDHHRLDEAAHNLSVRQLLVDFHGDDGAVRWNWRPL